MKDVMMTPQRNMMIIPFIITVTGGTPVVTEGGSWMTIVDGGVGIYQLTFGGIYGAKSARSCVVTANAVTATGDEQIVTIVAPSASGFTLEVNDDTGSATDMTVMGHCAWFGSADQR